MAQRIEYTDIGHRDPDSLLWVWNHTGSLEIRSIGDGTHNSIWRGKAITMFKGRYEPSTKRLSLMPPATMEDAEPPDALLGAFMWGLSGQHQPSKKGNSASLNFSMKMMREVAQSESSPHGSSLPAEAGMNSSLKGERIPLAPKLL